jgi:putative ABC transport system permease protein
LIWGSEDPIGADVRIGEADRGAWRRVVGIVGDVHHADVAASPTAAMYTPQTQITDSFLVLVIEPVTSDATSLVAPVRSILHELDPAVAVYDVAPLEALVAKASAQHVFVARLLTGFAVVAVLLAAVGLYGVISYNVAQRTREVGIRMALGARPVQIAAMIAAQAAWPIALGVAGGLAVAAATTRYLGALIFGVSPIDPPTLAAATALLLAASICAHWAPIRRALRIDSAGALREE